MKRRIKTHYSLVDEIMASPVEPINESLRAGYLRRMWTAYGSLAGIKPSYEAADVCVDAVAIVELLIATGLAEDSQGLLDDAKRAIGQSVRNYPAGPAVELTPEGAFAVQSVLEDYGDLMAQLPARTMIHCHRKVESSRIAAVKKAAGHAKNI